MLLAPFVEGLLSGDNLHSIIASLIPLFILAVAQTLVLISGGIDLSLTAVLALSSVAGAAVMQSGASAPVAVAAMLLIGAGIGGANGVAVAALRMPPFMVTLISLTLFSGLAIWFTRSKNIAGLTPGFLVLGKNLAAAASTAAICGTAIHLVLRYTVFGRWLYACGLNRRTARASGVPVGRVTVGVYIAAGILAAVSSVIYTARLETGSPVLGQRQLLDVVGAAVIGGASLMGGRGGVLSALGGALLFTILDNALNLVGLRHFQIMMVKGVVILAAATLDSRRIRPTATTDVRVGVKPR